MHPLVQSAIDAANQGDKPKAVELVRQILTANPNDIDAWLVLAAVVDDPQRKRQCLKRVLTIDPENQIAQEELLEMDGTPRSAAPSQPVAEPVSTIEPQPEPAPVSTNAISYETASAPAQPQARQDSPRAISAKPGSRKPLVFKYPLFLRIVMYVFVVVFGCSGLLVATQNVITSLPFLGLAFLLLLVALAFSPKVEISESGIRASGMLSSSEAQWGEITKMKSNAMKRRLELHKQNGEIVSVSTQVSGYPKIVEIIRKKRPDLFGIASSPTRSDTPGMTALPNADGSTSAPAFTGTKVFTKNAFAQYGVILLMIPLCLFGAWALVSMDEKFVGVAVILIGLFFMLVSLFNVNQIKVESNKITTESFFSQKEYTAREIREISMKTVRSRHGIATNFVSIQPVDGHAISLAGFSDGDEIIYGILQNWWNTYKNR